MLLKAYLEIEYGSVGKLRTKKLHVMQLPGHRRIADFINDFGIGGLSTSSHYEWFILW